MQAGAMMDLFGGDVGQTISQLKSRDLLNSAWWLSCGRTAGRLRQSAPGARHMHAARASGLSDQRGAVSSAIAISRRVPSGSASASAILAALGLRHRPQRGATCKRAQRRGAQMPNDKESSSDHAQSLKDSMLRSFSLLALPWVSFQREMLAIMKKGIEDTSHARPVQKLTLLELHALMMVMDPSRTWRGPFDADLEKKVEETYKETVPKLVSGSIQFIEVQDILLKRMSDALNTLKDGNKAKGHSK